MTNNYILRRIRFTFHYNDAKMIELFAKGGLAVTPEQVTLWLKKDDDPDYVRCTDHEFAHFLNGLTIEKRGPREDGTQPKAEYALNNNIIFRKLKIAFNLKDQDILDLLQNANFTLGKSELSAFFRKPDHRHYRECQDQVLRNFLQGLQLRETNTSTAERQSQFQAIKAKAANKKAAAQKERSNKKQSGHVNPYAKDKPKSEKVFYQNPNKKPKDEKEKRPTLTLKKDKQKNETPETKPARKEESHGESNGGFSWKK